jgi:DNA-binding response OmpR family regulator
MLFNVLYSQKRVLVIDDDASLQRQVSFHLEHKQDNITVFQALNGIEGIEQAIQLQPDLIILDWMLPDINGPEVLIRLKSNDQTKNIPVLMLSSRNNIGDIEDVFELDADSYVTKPFSLQLLGEKVVGLLN